MNQPKYNLKQSSVDALAKLFMEVDNHVQLGFSRELIKVVL